MPIELTDEDRAAIREATRGSAIRRDGTTSERIYRAGLAAGIERAAQVCEPRNDPSDWTEYAKIKAECVAAIRALLK